MFTCCLSEKVKRRATSAGYLLGFLRRGPRRDRFSGRRNLTLAALERSLTAEAWNVPRSPAIAACRFLSFEQESELHLNG